MDILPPLLKWLQNLVEVNTDYSSYSEEDKQKVFLTASIAKTLKNILELKLLEEDGSVSKDAEQPLEETNKFIDSINCRRRKAKKNTLKLSDILEPYEEELNYDGELYCGESRLLHIYGTKILNAIYNYTYGDESGELLVLFDKTIFGSGKEGFYLTGNEIYIKESFEDRYVTK